MREYIENIEKISETKIYYRDNSGFEYGEKRENTFILNEEAVFDVDPPAKRESIAELLREYVEIKKENSFLVKEIYRNQENTYAVMEVAALSLINGDKKEITEIFLKIIGEQISTEGTYLFDGETYEIYEEGALNLDREMIKETAVINKDKQDIFYTTINNMPAAGYNLRNRETIIFININESLVRERETLVKIMAEEFRVVIENREYRENLEKLYFKVIRRMADIINKRNYVYGDKYNLDTFIDIAEIIGKNYGLSREELRKLKIVSVLKDIGTLLVPENILHKVGALTAQEYNILKRHPIYSSNILEQTEYFEEFITQIKHHHEKWGGDGYPAGLKGKEIPLISRIVHITDVFMALISQRVYRKQHFNLDDAKEIICANKDNHFDPELIKIFGESYGDIKLAVKNNS